MSCGTLFIHYLMEQKKKKDELQPELFPSPWGLRILVLEDELGHLRGWPGSLELLVCPTGVGIAGFNHWWMN